MCEKIHSAGKSLVMMTTDRFDTSYLYYYYYSRREPLSCAIDGDRPKVRPTIRMVMGAAAGTDGGGKTRRDKILLLSLLRRGSRALLTRRITRVCSTRALRGKCTKTKKKNITLAHKCIM